MASRSETQQKTQQAQREREKAQRDKERDKERAERDKEREARSDDQGPPEQAQQGQQGQEMGGPPPPMKILKAVPSPARAETKDKNYGIKGKCKKPEKIKPTDFSREAIIKRMFTARADRLRQLKDVTRTSLDIAMGLTRGTGSGHSVSTAYGGPNSKAI